MRRQGVEGRFHFADRRHGGVRNGEFIREISFKERVVLVVDGQDGSIRDAWMRKPWNMVIAKVTMVVNPFRLNQMVYRSGIIQKHALKDAIGIE
jgi:hypothetical protein